MKIHEPVGVIGVVCPDDYPLLGFVSLFAPAVVRGNAVVIIPSEKHPLLALDLYQVSNYVMWIKVMLLIVAVFCVDDYSSSKSSCSLGI